MPQIDATEEFLRDMPELAIGQNFRFRCHPGVSCFNACCSDLTLMLTPFDVLRLRRALGLPSRECIAAYADQLAAPDTGLPMLRLRMVEDAPGKPCPFVRAAGCSVYPDRPGACRTYPLGRAARVGDGGEIAEQFFIVREDHCRGFDADSPWTSAAWLADQELRAYNAANDRYLRLTDRVRRTGARLSAGQANMAYLALYNLDDFTRFIRDVRLFDKIVAAPGRAQAVLASEEAALEFGFDWLELTLFGSNQAISRPGKPCSATPR
ncbi:MAG: YkgJ family cysteine cluster protein [Desulfovibrionaceae bacterium]|nr:YkgJ family cysteine cluster protein [Desulfovibrionaceae bacterium]MBF0514004.1 YkgJ family cysteine cluster protein [Desulfovibrionaceae bacterium]